MGKELIGFRRVDVNLSYAKRFLFLFEEHQIVSDGVSESKKQAGGPK